MNLAALLDRAGRCFAERTALARGTHAVSDYRRMAGRVAALAAGLTGKMGLRRGDRVALVMKNCPEYAELMFACWRAGLTAVPVNAKLAPAEFQYILDHSGARACFATPDLTQTVGGFGGSRAGVEIGSAEWRGLGEGDGMPIAPCDADDIAWLFYTSGTTGRPKGAMLTHRNLFAMCWGYFADVDAIAPGDAILHAAPMSHGSGIYIIPHVAAGAAQIVPESGGFEPEDLFALFAAHDGVSMFAAPTMVHRLVAAAERTGPDLRGLKTIIYGGGPMYVEDCKRAIAALGDRLAQIYGQGESPMTITSLAKHRYPKAGEPRFEERLASVGIPFGIVDVQVVDGDDRPLPPGEAGEILVRGDSVMRGYWQNEDATAETLRGGWLHTGDVGAFDADGYLTLKDRSKDVIISGGTNIYPREVEEVLLEHPAVREVSVVGKPDPDWGESVVAFVVCEAGHALEKAELDNLCLAKIARFKRPKEYRFLDALPKNNYGKVLKTELRQRLDEPK